MRPIYKFELSAGETTQRAFPIYKDDLAKDFEKESGQEFFRAKLSGNLTFESADYEFIVGKAFDTEFGLEIFVSTDAGQTWVSYWRGKFYKTDCEFDIDSGTVVVKPTVVDIYNDVLAGLDKEFNLIDLAPDIVQVYADKRPIVQMYIPGQSSIACFMGGSYWEQDCEVVGETDTVEVSGESVNKLTAYLFFNKLAAKRVIQTEGVSTIPDVFMGDQPASNFTDFTFTNGAYKFIYRAVGTGSGSEFYFEIARVSDSVVMWRYSGVYDASHTTPPFGEISYNLTPVIGSGATGVVQMSWYDIPVYARYVCDVSVINNFPTFKIPVDDLTGQNPNYHYVFPYGRTGVVYFGTGLTATPNKWGLYQPGQYYQPPQVSQNPELFPVSRSAWGRVSVWFTFFRYDIADDIAGRKQFVIKHAYSLSSVISVLLGQIATGITHEPTTAYSQFLYGENLLEITQTLLITPKSNVVTAGYDQPAQNAPITLRQVLNMLRDCFRCYWFIDSSNRFRVEHIKFFMNGGSYTATPVIGVDLTAQKVTRNGKPWAFGLDQYRYEKPEMAARYQFGWMDEVTQFFNGYPMEIVSKYVNPEMIEQITVAGFTSDIDYIIMNPGGVSKDGFVLLSAVLTNVSSGEVSIDVSAITSCGSYIDANGKWATQYVNNYYGGLVNVTAYRGKNYKIVSSGGGSYAFVKSGVSLGNAVDFATGWSAYEAMPGDGTEYTGVIPDDAVYLYVYLQSAGTSYRPRSITILGVQSTEFVLPYYEFTKGVTEHRLQNGYVAFYFLENYYVYDMPASQFKVNGVTYTAQGVKRLKSQNVNFPALADPDLQKLIKTNIGNGTIEKLSVNLSSRNAKTTLRYDTE